MTHVAKRYFGILYIVAQRLIIAIYCIICNSRLTRLEKAVAATFTEDGLTEGRHCETCGAVFAAQKAVKATGHKEVIDKEINATCTKEEKSEGSHCEICGEILKAQLPTPKARHH